MRTLAFRGLIKNIVPTAELLNIPRSHQCTNFETLGWMERNEKYGSILILQNNCLQGSLWSICGPIINPLNILFY